MPRSGSASSPYAPAANLLSQILDEKKSFKKLVYSKDGTLKCSKVTYAQVCQVLSYKKILDQILQKVPSLLNDIHNTGLLHVLVYELLLGPNQSLRGGGAVKRKLMQHEPELRNALKSPKISQQLKEYALDKKQQHCFPRYARVNTLLISLEEVCQTLLKEQQKLPPKKGGEFEFEFYIDPHVPDLLVLPPSIVTDTMSTASSSSTTPDSSSSATTTTPLQQIQRTIKSWIQSGKIILQDKSSCFPAFCLLNGFDDDIRNNNNNNNTYLDACAAPGNKTQHLAALLGGGGVTSLKSGSSTPSPATVYALDRSKERLVSLQQRMQQLAPSDHESSQRVQIVAQECDFLQTSPEDFSSPNKNNSSNICAILLDPSCSGSGIMTAPDRWTEQQQQSSAEETPDGQETKRVESLAKFQEKALSHAMTSFPTVSRIVYSTCSLHERENEMVVLKSLANASTINDTNNQDKEEEGKGEKLGRSANICGSSEWEIVAPKCLEQWKRRGHVVEGLSEEGAKCMIRACAEDETNGFFVCCLERQMTPKEKHGNCKQARTHAGTSMVQSPKGTTFYNGQFARKSVSKKVPQAPKSNDKMSPRPSSPDKPVKTGVKKRESSKTKDNNSKPPEAENSSGTIIPKKVAKRLAWKKRQMEQKQQRLKQKKQKTENKD